MTYAINEPIAAANFPYLKNLEENARLHSRGKRENLVEKFKLGTFLRVATTIPSIISHCAHNIESLTSNHSLVLLLDPICSLRIAIDTVCVTRMKYFLVLSWLLSQGNSFSIWEQRSRNIPNFRTSHHINHNKIIRSSTLLKANDQSESYD